MKLVFFDYSFVDCSFKTRSLRQIEEFEKTLKKIAKNFLSNWEVIEVKIWRAKREFKKLFKPDVTLLDFEIIGLSSTRDSKDLSVDGYINKHGGIVSNVDNKVYTNKREYLQHLKDNGCVINDWKQESRKPAQISQKDIREAAAKALQQFQ